jgi:3-oxoadipate enol-lactonase
VKLHYRFDGADDAPVLVLASSLGATHAMWNSNVDAFTRRYRVLRYDHRGHGASEVPPGPYTVEELAADVIALLDDLELERVSFLGLSLGGAVGMALALASPERIERLVLCCTAAKFGTPEGWAERTQLVREQGLEAIVDAVLERWFTPRLHELEPQVFDEFRSTFLSTPREGYAACCEALRDWDIRTRLPEIEVPTTCVAGADDPSTPPSDLELLAEGIPDAALIVIPDARHLANVEQPEAFALAALA